MNIVSTSVAVLLAAASAEAETRKADNAMELTMTETAEVKNHPYVGMWVTSFCPMVVMTRREAVARAPIGDDMR